MSRTSSPAAARPAALLTGAAGFLGRRVARAWLAAGGGLVALDRVPAPPGLAGRPGLTWLSGSVLAAEDLARALAALPPGKGAVLIHLAGLAHAGRCQEDPALAEALNHHAAVAAARALLAAGHRRMVFPSTAYVYDRALGREAYREEDPVAPRGVYAEGKWRAEQALVRLAREAGLGLRVARLANLYGPDGHPDTVPQRALAQAVAGGPLSLRDPGPVRDFLHVADAAAALVALALAPDDEAAPVVYNVASGVGTSVGELARLVAALAGLGAPSFARPPAAGPPDRLVLANRRIRAALGWVPRLDLRAGLEQSLEEMRAHG